MNSWTLVEDGLPLEDYRGQKVFNDYLVTVMSNDYETYLNEEPQVVVLWFCAKRMCFYRKIGLVPYEDENSHWHIVAWMEKPEPYGVRK